VRRFAPFASIVACHLVASFFRIKSRARSFVLAFGSNAATHSSSGPLSSNPHFVTHCKNLSRSTTLIISAPTVCPVDWSEGNRMMRTVDPTQRPIFCHCMSLFSRIRLVGNLFQSVPTRPQPGHNA